MISNSQPNSASSPPPFSPSGNADMATAALDFARRGCYVLPLYPLNEDGSCGCGDPRCKRGGKHPMTEKGFHDATRDATTIRRWWGAAPDAGVAIGLHRSGLAIIDIDSSTFLELYASHDWLPETFVVESRPGHRHFYYRLPEDYPATQVIRRGQFDILAIGMIVAPPSPHKSGTRYTPVHAFPWNTVDDLPYLPGWAAIELEDAGERNRSYDEVAFTPAGDIDGGATYQGIEKALHPSIQILIQHGHTALDETIEDRSGADWRVIAALIEAGMGDDEITAIFQTFPIGTESKYAERGDRYLAATIAKARLHVRMKQQQAEAAVETSSAFNASTAPRKDDDPTQLLMEIGLTAELFHSPEGEQFAAVPVRNHVEVHPITAPPFRKWLRHRFYETMGQAPGREMLDRVIEQLNSKAEFDGSIMPVSLRVAQVGDNVYIDLGNEDWDVVEVSPLGWQVLPSSESAARFRRGKAMQALPMPQRGGSLQLLRKHLNVDDAGWPLVVGWLLMALHPVGPYPVLNLYGEQGSAKSTAAKMLRRLTDPSAVSSRGEPRGEDELRAAVVNNWTILLDNLSTVHPWLSDALCRISTEGGFATRAYYTTMEETAVHARRPVIITSITEVANRSDLVDRSLLVTLHSLQGHWREEATIWDEFESDAPYIFGAMLDAMVTALQRQHTVPTQSRVRMSDFAHWVVAAEPALPWQNGTFMDAYLANRSEATEMALEATPVGQALIEFMERVGYWEGTATQLKEELERVLESSDDFGTRRSKAWPETGRGMSGALTRIAPNLRTIGIEVERPPRTSGARLIQITDHRATRSRFRAA